MSEQQILRNLVKQPLGFDIERSIRWSTKKSSELLKLIYEVKCQRDPHWRVGQLS
jgi:hypothetical protein